MWLFTADEPRVVARATGVERQSMRDRPLPYGCG